MNGPRTSLRHYRRPYEAGPEDDHVSGPFFIPVIVIAWKSNPWRPLRHGANRMATDLSPKRTKARQRGQRIVFRGKDGPRVERNQRRAEANQFHRRAIPAKIGEIRMRIRMRFRLRRAEEASMPTGGRVKA